ncbi:MULTISPECIES: TetR/AcrR family transcriptional regulator [unclassified Actinoplanes]|uniref:TetR/AcrR family transcriptional regulator n=1 Tax=unclassified Actinoplanes TaxID=2626549 RepID=UPI0009C30023|nr:MULTISPECIES: TetR/AcrR family transcriptional regulator [unclassified Actinoplanes]SLM01116.1 hypothetical protein ACSP50_4349 [Actinoplanes sp. SE50/110]
MRMPYESTGRTRQKSRTRQALVEATRELLADGLTPRVEDAAAHSGISRTTAYRYFANQHSLLLAAQPQIQPDTLLDATAPTEPRARMTAFMDAFTAYNLQWEPQLRSALRLSLAAPRDTAVPTPDRPELRFAAARAHTGRHDDTVWHAPPPAATRQGHPDSDPTSTQPDSSAPAGTDSSGSAGTEQPLLRRGRAIGWIEDALRPLADSHPAIDRRSLAVAIRSATGIESLIWLIDIAAQTRDQAAATVQGTALALLDAAMNQAPPQQASRADNGLHRQPTPG